MNGSTVIVTEALPSSAASLALSVSTYVPAPVSVALVVAEAGFWKTTAPSPRVLAHAHVIVPPPFWPGVALPARSTVTLLPPLGSMRVRSGPASTAGGYFRLGSAGRTTASLQTLVDYPQTFLSFAGIEAPRTMTGVDQSGVRTGREKSARDHVIVENRHQPTTLHVKTYVDERYKLTIYHGRTYGELFDLRKDPGEFRNLWTDRKHRKLRNALIGKLLAAEMGKEPVLMPRVSGA